MRTLQFFGTSKTGKLLLLAGNTIAQRGGPKRKLIFVFLGRWWNMWQTSMGMKLSLESFCLVLPSTSSGTMAPIHESSPEQDGGERIYLQSELSQLWPVVELFPLFCDKMFQLIWWGLQVHLVPGLNQDGYETMSPSGRSWLPLHENANKVDIDTWDDLINILG